MSLVALITKLTTPKPKCKYPAEPIEGTDLKEGIVEGGIVIYNSKTNKVLFGGPNPDLWYRGRLGQTHIASKEEEIDGERKAYFVDEKGNRLFGKKHYSRDMLFVDSNKESYINIDWLDPIGIAKGTEDTIVEIIDQDYPSRKNVLNVYDLSGRVLGKDIPGLMTETEKSGCGDSTRGFAATRLYFANVDGQLLLEVKYWQKSEVYELNKVAQTNIPEGEQRQTA
jgi:hypothetical protein